MNSIRLGLLFESKPEVGSGVKSPPRKCKNSARLWFWGVGTSGSTIATTKDVLLVEFVSKETKKMSGCMEVS